MAKSIYKRSEDLHRQLSGKLEINLTTPLETRDDLSLLYTPGVAEPCRIIARDKQEVYNLTGKGSLVAVVTDGTAVLGLGDIGPEAALPVMEGKCALFKRFGGVNAVPICLNTKDPKEIIATVKAIAPGFGGINLEDISAPRCVEIERTLIEELDIPVFHDDQHGTAIVVAAAMINAVKVVSKNISDLTVVVSGTGAAGSSIIKMLHNLGVKEIYGFNINGIVTKADYEQYDFLTKEISLITNSKAERLSMAEAMTRADAFVGVSAPNLVTQEMVKSMKKDPIVFAMANPEPEIGFEEGVAAGARIMGTGRSDFPNQINNVLAFPGIFKGALDCQATKITEGMKLAAAFGLASMIKDEALNEYSIIPDAMHPGVAYAVAKAVVKQAMIEGVAQKRFEGLV